MTSHVAGASETLAVAEGFIDAYNAKDFDTLSRLLADDIRMRHHNRGVDITGPEAVLGIMDQFEGAFPDRRFHSIRRRLLDGEHVVIEHTWEATATVDVEGFAAAGEVARLDLCTIYTIRNGQIVAYDDYG